jgi:tRNA-uridine 2-sulfurtransferase
LQETNYNVVVMKTVYVGMSGGVDSSVAAALLLEQGYSVVGVYMKNWTADIAGVACPWKQDLADARAAAVMLDIPFKVFDFQTEYKQKVVDAMVSEYQAGRTPNPDILCNQEIKFKLFLETALADGADLVATGHYAAIQDGKLQIPHDTTKDQTYFLYRMPAASLSNVLFPLGEMTKVEVRAKATELDLPTATKPDSQGICFVGEVGIKAFLKQYITTEPGPIIDNKKNIVGHHDGAIFYTIGQRHGLGIGGGEPYFVTGKNMEKNEVYVTTDSAARELSDKSFYLTETHWLSQEPDPSGEYQVRVRHRGKLIPCRLEREGERYLVIMAEQERAIAAGQSAVIYDGQTVIGGGIISA